MNQLEKHHGFSVKPLVCVEVRHPHQMIGSLIRFRFENHIHPVKHGSGGPEGGCDYYTAEDAEKLIAFFKEQGLEENLSMDSKHALPRTTKRS